MTEDTKLFVALCLSIAAVVFGFGLMMYGVIGLALRTAS